MTPEEMRLKCLELATKLCASFDPVEVLSIAKDLERYVFGGQ